MRKHFHRDLRGKIMGELAKDFSRRPLEDIASMIAAAWSYGAPCLVLRQVPERKIVGARNDKAHCTVTGF
jgi:hypothetical protein